MPTFATSTPTPARATATASTSAAAGKATAGALLAGLGLVDDELPPAHVKAAEGVDGGVALLGVGHFDEAEASGASGLAIHDDGGELDLAVLPEELLSSASVVL